MKSLKDLLPSNVFNELVDYILNFCPDAAKDSWRRSRSDEDALSGDFWGGICKRETFSKSNSKWKWGLEYKKIRGRGPAAFEKSSGADGIFEVCIINANGKIVFQKAFLYQAKKEGNNSGIESQLFKMNKIAPNGSLLVTYQKNKFKVSKSEDYLSRKSVPADFDICDFIAHQFFECLFGIRNMTLDIDEDELTVVQTDGSKKLYKSEIRDGKTELLIRKIK